MKKQVTYMIQEGDKAFAMMPMTYDSDCKAFMESPGNSQEEADVTFAGLIVKPAPNKEYCVTESKRYFIKTMGKEWLDNAIKEGSATVEEIGESSPKNTPRSKKKEIAAPSPTVQRGESVSLIEDILSIHSKYERDVMGRVDIKQKITQDQHDSLMENLERTTYYDVSRLVDDYAAECEEKHIPFSKRKNIPEIMAMKSNKAGKKSRESRSEIKSILETISRIHDDNTYYITNAYIRGVGRVPVHAKKNDHMLEVQAIMDEVCRKYGFPSYAILPGTYEGELPRIIHWDILEKIKNDNRKD